ncbi:hypothetical protein VQ02_15495 [Methylobacterium variabile]|jgi:hypothetical protein|uniref:Uncharacterized protein n=1 Tax=Methylobacterium variabile TaxID=298794 RepID=A0A0J6SMC4_9HYPH|nr:hypothetical protein [Methylobacterium variabile]KMO36365.1 hypothetical protein VQ02_15495 [Methylobacterium variabile]
MPTDLPSRYKSPRSRGATALRTAVVGLRLRLLGWRIEKALEDRDHARLLRLTAAWDDLRRDRAADPASDPSRARDRRWDMACERVRRAVPKIEREERRLAWVVERMGRARAARDERAYERSCLLGRAAQERLIQLWGQI